MEKNLLFNLEEQLQELQNLDNYDADKYIHSLMHQTGQLNYFYGHLCEKNSPDETFYKINKKPKVHELAYFNIGRGFPKELQDGHWCYVVKDFNSKMLVIPCTSIKDDTNCNNKYKMDIIVNMDDNITKSRLSFSDMRCIDLQRLDLRKRFVNVLTDKEEILSVISSQIIS